MVRRSPLDVFLWPVSLICSLGMLLPIWNHHGVIETRAGFVSRDTAQAWAKQEAHDRKCLPGSNQTEIQDASESGLDTTNGHPVTITLKCHQSSIWWKVIAVFVGPWLLLFLAVRMVGPAKEEEE